MQVADGNVATLQKFKPAFTVALYNTKVDVVGNHLSGLLLIKKMPDSSTRMVFSNEMGFKYFDFEFSAAGNFKVYSIIQQMNKNAVLKTLRKDFELILMNPLDSSNVDIRKNEEGLIYYVFPQTKGFYYYITNPAVDQLLRMERASKRKVVVAATVENYINGMPDSIAIIHQTFNFTIGLKRIER